MLTIDSREPHDEITENLVEVPYTDYEITALDAKTDFLLAGDDQPELGIQRKSVNDFVSSLDSLKDNLHTLRSNRELSALLVEGHWKTAGDDVALRRGQSLVPTVPLSVWHHFQVSQQLRGTLLLHTSSLSETCKLLASLDGYMSGERTAPTRQAEEPSSLLTVIPQIGGGRAQNIMDEYESLYDAVLNVGEWDDVDMVGEATQQQAMDFLLGDTDA